MMQTEDAIASRTEKRLSLAEAQAFLEILGSELCGDPT